MLLLNSFNLLMFISILNTQKINSYDLINIYGMIFFSICFYILIFIDKIVNVKYYIDIIHIFIIFNIGIFSLFFENTYLIFVVILCLNIILFYWSYLNQCPLGRYSYYFNKMNELTDKYQKNVNNGIYILLFILYKKMFSKILIN
jgi:hypothetical protein